MKGPISFWGYKEQESNLILAEHDYDDDDDDEEEEHKIGASPLQADIVCVLWNVIRMETLNFICKNNF
jgi:hypothetical protein